MKKKTLFSFMGLFIIFLLSSCNNDYDVQRDDATSRVDSNFVSLKNAKSIATTYEFTNLKTRSKIGKKNIASIYSLKKKSGLPEMYVVNYEGGGFLVISADKRVNEILAYSEDSSFPIDDNVEMPEGVASWMDGYAFLVDSIRKYNVTNFLENGLAIDSKTRTRALGELPLGEWGACNKGQSDVRFCAYDGDDLEPYFYFVPAIIHTNWDQGVGYNDLLDNMGCSTYSNGRPPVGCVAVAMAQIMRNYQLPTSFNWAAMPNTQGAYATQVLMKDIGTKVKMQYDCSGSGAYDSDALAAFKQYGYKNAKFIDCDNGDDVMNIWRQLIKGSPVYASGLRDADNAHAFYIHGIEITQVFRCTMDYEADRMTTYPYITKAYYFINWGWGGRYNGLFLRGNFEPISGHNYNKKMRFIGDFN